MYSREIRAQISIGGKLLLKSKFDLNCLEIGYNNVLEW
jgi:hypothetical protein